MGDCQVDDETITTFLRNECGGELIIDFGTGTPRDHREGAVEVLWVTPLTKHAHFKSPYVAYGNEATLGCVYGDVCLMVQVGPTGRRATSRV
jgi:hypothetical protein